MLVRQPHGEMACPIGRRPTIIERLGIDSPTTGAMAHADGRSPNTYNEGKVFSEEMARRQRISSNELFETFARWSRLLESI